MSFNDVLIEYFRSGLWKKTYSDSNVSENWEIIIEDLSNLNISKKSFVF